MAAAAGIVAATDTASAAMPVTETDVTIKTSDGTCDAAFIHPTSGSHPAVIVWADAFGLRPAMRDIGKRIAAEGYSVLVPNPFYRVKPGPAVDNIASFNFQTDMPKIQPLMASINAPGNCEKDATAFVAWLDQQKPVNTSKKIGTQGYCMGGPLVLKTCATRPDRVGAGGSFHGGGLVSDNPDSPHLLATKIKARMYFGITSNDDMHLTDAPPKTSCKRHLSRRRMCRGDRGLCWRAAWLVRAGHAAAKWPADLQQAGRRARLGQARSPVQGRAGLSAFHTI